MTEQSNSDVSSQFVIRYDRPSKCIEAAQVRAHVFCKVPAIGRPPVGALRYPMTICCALEKVTRVLRIIHERPLYPASVMKREICMNIFIFEKARTGTPLKWEVVASFIALEHDTLTIAHNFLLNGMKWIARCIRYKHCVHSLYTNVLYIICKHKNIDGRLSIKLSNKKARGKVKKKK